MGAPIASTQTVWCHTWHAGLLQTGQITPLGLSVLKKRVKGYRAQWPASILEVCNTLGTLAGASRFLKEGQRPLLCPRCSTGRQGVQAAGRPGSPPASHRQSLAVPLPLLCPPSGNATSHQPWATGREEHKSVALSLVPSLLRIPFGKTPSRPPRTTGKVDLPHDDRAHLCPCGEGPGGRAGGIEAETDLPSAEGSRPANGKTGLYEGCAETHSEQDSRREAALPRQDGGGPPNRINGPVAPVHGEGAREGSLWHPCANLNNESPRSHPERKHEGGPTSEAERDQCEPSPAVRPPQIHLLNAGVQPAAWDRTQQTLAHGGGREGGWTGRHAVHFWQT